jgi:hypothetical protein
VKEALDKVLSSDAIRLLLERTGGLLDQLTGGADGDDTAQPADDEQADDERADEDEYADDDDEDAVDDDEQGDDGEHEGSYGGCRGAGQASTWWSGSQRSGCP